MDRSALDAAYAAAVRYLQGLPERPVGASADAAAIRAALAVPLPEQGEPAARVVEALARNADPGIVASGGPRFFGFVIGGSVPAALAADWLTSAWDQNAGLFVLSPAAAVVEETVLGWLRELVSLPEGTGMGFVTGGQMANTTCLAAARQAVLARSRWDVAAEGLTSAPRIVVLEPPTAPPWRGPRPICSDRAPIATTTNGRRSSPAGHEGSPSPPSRMATAGPARSSRACRATGRAGSRARSGGGGR